MSVHVYATFYIQEIIQSPLPLNDDSIIKLIITEGTFLIEKSFRYSSIKYLLAYLEKSNPAHLLGHYLVLDKTTGAVSASFQQLIDDLEKKYPVDRLTTDRNFSAAVTRALADQFATCQLPPQLTSFHPHMRFEFFNKIFLDHYQEQCWLRQLLCAGFGRFAVAPIYRPDISNLRFIQIKPVGKKIFFTLSYDVFGYFGIEKL